MRSIVIPDDDDDDYDRDDHIEPVVLGAQVQRLGNTSSGIVLDDDLTDAEEELLATTPIVDAGAIIPAYPRFPGLPDLPAIRTLRARQQWVAWKYVPQPGARKQRKVPINPATGYYAKTDDPATWGSYEAATSCAQQYNWPGVGYVLTAEDELCGFDLDDCRNPSTGEPTPFAAEVVALGETYIEVSPSGQGLRGFALGKPDKATKCDAAHVEIYGTGRYLTITGRHLTGTPDEIMPAPNSLARLLERVEAFRPQEQPARLDATQRGPEGGQNGFWSAVNAAALANLSAWVPALFRDAKPSGTGYRVTSAALGRDLQEDLSITPQGIKDFGVHDLGDAREGRRSAVDLVMEYGGSADASEAARWLCERVGVAPESLGWKGAAAPAALDGPLPLFPELPPAEPYPVAALGPVLGEAARAIARKIQVPESMAAQSVLSAASLAAQALGDVMLPYGQTRPLSLFFVTVAASGDRKTSADNEALAPVKHHEKILRELHEPALAEWQAARAAWAAERSRVERDKKLDFNARKAGLAALGNEPLRPLAPFLVTGDLTVEGLTKNWGDAHAALGIFTNEGGTFTGGHAMTDDNRLKTAAMLSKVWDGEPVKRVRAGDGVTILPGRRLSMHIMVQPDAAAGFLGNLVLRDQGLLSRVLVAAPESLAGTRFHRASDPADARSLMAYYKRILALLDAPLPLADGRNELVPRALTLDLSATELSVEFRDRIERQLGLGQDLVLVRDFAAKAAEHAARLAGVLTIVEDERATTIGRENMAAAVKLADWYTKEALRLHHAGRRDPKLVQAEALRVWFLDRGEAVVPFRDVMRLGPTATRTKAAAEQAINLLLGHGWIVQASGRPLSYRLAPGVSR